MPSVPLITIQEQIGAWHGEAEDEALAQRAKRDPEAFAELYRRYTHRIYRFHLSRTGSEPEAQDLTAQTFLSALEGLPAYRGAGSFAGWLFGIARHKLADHYRERKPHLPLVTADELPDEADLPEQTVMERLDFQRVAAALRNLSPDRADALTLRFFGGLNAAEIGRLLDKSEAAAKMLLHRGLNDLQRRLAAPLTEES